MKYTLTLGLTALFTCTAFAAFNAPLPEFKNEKELAQWRAENASKLLSNSATEEPAFFTGKPYLESTSSYAFKYRNYNPEIARWTSEDPSGFPDGANGSAYAPNPNSELDYQGLVAISFNFSGSTTFNESPFKELNPNVTGTISYEMNEDQTHFTVPATGVYGDKTGAWSDVIPNTGESAIYTTGVIQQVGSGTVSIGGQNVWKKDWIDVQVTLSLAVTKEQGGHLTTNNFSPIIYSVRKWGNPYE